MERGWVRGNRMWCPSDCGKCEAKWTAQGKRRGPPGGDGKDLVYGDAVTYTCNRGFAPDSKPSPIPATWTIKCTEAGVFETGLQCLPAGYVVLGRVTDATNGEAIAGAVMKLSTTVNGVEVKWDAESNEAGVFGFENVNGGKMSMEAAVDNYVSATAKLDVTQDIEIGTQADVSLSPVLPPDGWRVIVKWGHTPTDMDTHLSWATPFGGCFVDYSNPIMTCMDGVSASLDIDDTEHFGPETLTIEHVGKGKNRCTEQMHKANQCQVTYKVNNFSQDPASMDGTRVSLYNGDKLIKEFASEKDGKIEEDFWTVFTLDTYANALVETK